MPILFAGIAILAILGLLAAIWSQPNSQRQQITYQQQPTTNNQAAAPPAQTDTNQNAQEGGNKQEDQNYWERFITWTGANDKAISAISTVVIATFTAALFLATFLLWFGGERHSERQLRAYISFDRGSVVDWEGTAPVILAVFKNFGQTPAYNVVYRVEAQASDIPLSQALTMTDKAFQSSAGVVGPTASLSIKQALQNPPIAEIKKFLVGPNKALYLFGRIDYVDAFKAPRWTTFCLFYNPTDPAAGKVDLAICGQGNDAN